MAEENDNYIGFRTSSKEAEQAAQRIQDELRKSEADWLAIANQWRQLIDLMNKGTESEEVRTVLDSPMNANEKLSVAISLWQMQTAKWVILGALTVANLGTELSQTHQRLAAVEKELTDLRAALRS